MHLDGAIRVVASFVKRSAPCHFPINQSFNVDCSITQKGNNMKLLSICGTATTAAAQCRAPHHDDDGVGIGLPEQVLRARCMFGVIAEFCAVNDLVSLSSSSNAMRKAVTGLRHWKCGAENHEGRLCNNNVFCDIGLSTSCVAPSCCQKCKMKLCPGCTVRCQSCHEIKCLDCDLDLCVPCNVWYCLQCKYGPPCSGCGTVYG